MPSPITENGLLSFLSPRTQTKRNLSRLRKTVQNRKALKAALNARKESATRKSSPLRKASPSRKASPQKVSPQKVSPTRKSPPKNYNRLLENYLRERNAQLSTMAARRATGNTKIFAQGLIKASGKHVIGTKI